MSLPIDQLLKTVVRERATDLRLSPGQPPGVILRGRTITLDTKQLTPADTHEVMQSITPERNQQEFRDIGTTNFKFAFSQEARFEVNASSQDGGVALVFRRIPNEW
jgi:twitching motility protein PilT